MSAETLRKAAAKIRDRATAATDPGWGWYVAEHAGGNEVWAKRDAAGWDEFMVATTITRLNPNPGVRGYGDAAHIASWSPTVTLFVAEWLDQAADWREDNPDDVDDDPDLAEVNDPALVFARAYLGEQP